MNEMNNITEVELTKISEEGFLDYAQEANSRSTLSAQDGLKPVHRRVLYIMNEVKAFDFTKSPNIVGEVIKIHPHGDAAIYDTAVRLSQPFKMRYPLIDFKGNNGSITNDRFAASRYTAMKLSAIGKLMLAGMDKKAAEMIPDFDGDGMEPKSLPSSFPNILANGGSGIGVAMSCNIPPHNLKELIDALIYFIQKPQASTSELVDRLTGPDFPTGGVIINANKIKDIYDHGKGSLRLRCKYHLETVEGFTHVVVTEVPYLVSIEGNIIKPIKKLVEEDGYTGIYDLQNNCGKNGVEIRIIIDKKTSVDEVLRLLWKKTALETTIKVNFTVLLQDRFVQLNLKGLFVAYVQHQHACLIRAARFNLDTAEKKLNLVEGQIKVLADIDRAIKIIKGSVNKAAARSALMQEFDLNALQADGVLAITLSRLTSLEIEELKQKRDDLKAEVLFYTDIINNKETRDKQLIKNLEAMAALSDPRRTELNNIQEVEAEEVPEGEEPLVPYLVLATGNMLIAVDSKTTSLGASSESLAAVLTNSHNSVLIFGRNGKVVNYPIKNLKLNEPVSCETIIGDTIVGMIPANMQEMYMICVTTNGLIKKTAFSDYQFKRAQAAIKLKQDDSLAFVLAANDDQYLFAIDTLGKQIIYNVSDIKSTGKATMGTKYYSNPIQSITVIGQQYYKVPNRGKIEIAEITPNECNSKGSSGVKSKVLAVLPIIDQVFVFHSKKMVLTSVNDGTNFDNKKEAKFTVLKIDN